jgi:hypothetical protein
MKKYRVRCYFGTDLRDERIVEGDNELEALVRARVTGWVDDAKSRIEITLF